MVEDLGRSPADGTSRKLFWDVVVVVAGPKGYALRQAIASASASASAANTASRNRATVSAANMSPVPLKKQSRRGTSTLKRRGLPSERAVEPIMVSVSVLSVAVELDTAEVVEDVIDGSCTEVMIMCGTL